MVFQLISLLYPLLSLKVYAKWCFHSMQPISSAAGQRIMSVRCPAQEPEIFLPFRTTPSGYGTRMSHKARPEPGRRVAGDRVRCLSLAGIAGKSMRRSRAPHGHYALTRQLPIFLSPFLTGNSETPERTGAPYRPLSPMSNTVRHTFWPRRRAVSSYRRDG